jgi:hypothetical protein
MPPMLRRVPYWYARFYDAVMTSFEDAVKTSTLQSVYVMPSLPGLSFSRDCVHLSDKSGPEYVTHMLEKACQFNESEFSEPELKLESSINIQSTRTTGVVADVSAVKVELSELSMAVAEEMDGRVNVE